MGIKASEHPGISLEPFITPNPETLTIEVEEAVIYRHTLTVTTELLDEAEAEGYARTAQGVLEMFQGDPDHDVVANSATRPSNFVCVAERNTERAYA